MSRSGVNKRKIEGTHEPFGFKASTNYLLCF